MASYGVQDKLIRMVKIMYEGSDVQCLMKESVVLSKKRSEATRCDVWLYFPTGSGLDNEENN